MPVDGSAGWSEGTAKYAHFDVVVRTHLTVVRHIWAKWRGHWHPRYLYFDLTAGPGRYAGGREGSPLRILRLADAARVPVAAYLFERDPATYERLRATFDQVAAVDSFPDARVETCAGDSEAQLPAVLGRLAPGLMRDAHGLVFVDPNGAPRDLRTALAAARQIVTTPRLSKVDVLVHLMATSYKRAQQGTLLLSDLASVGKRHIWLRRPEREWHFSFAILSGWRDFPEFRAQGFARVGTPEGDDIAAELELTRDAYARRHQLALPFDLPRPSLPTGPMPSTFAIRASAPSERPSSLGPAGSVSGAGALAPPRATT